MRNFVFMTFEGYTYQPGSESPEPDIENCQVIGIARGKDEEEAFKRMVRDNGYLLKTSFNEVVSFELKHQNHHSRPRYFNLDNMR